MKKVVCINDSARPNDVPTSRWIKKGNEYTITSVCWMEQQGIYGCKLAEINNDDLFPYQFFALTRFAISEDTIKKAVQEKELELEEVY